MWLLVTLAVLVVGYLGLTWFAHWGERWGATPDEFALPLIGDRWLEGGPKARARMTRAVWIDAPPEHVWPWLAQMGRGAGWYSYDRLDNGGRESARHLVSWVPEARVGDAGIVGYLRLLEPGRELAWWLGDVRFLGAPARNVMHYRVTGDGARTRLLMRMQADARGPLARLALWTYRVIDSIMARRQLLGIKKRAERYGTRGEDPDRPETGARDQFQHYQVLYADGGEAGAPGRTDAAKGHRAAVDDGVVDA